GADHVHLAVGEVDHADDAVDHGVADGDQAIDRTQRQAVDHLLQENAVHVCISSKWTGPLTTTASSGSRTGTAEPAPALLASAVPAAQQRRAIRIQQCPVYPGSCQGTAGRALLRHCCCWYFPLSSHS